MVDIVLIASYSLIYNTRVQKIIRSLDKKYSISMLGWNREQISNDKIKSNPFKISLFNLRAPYGNPKLVFYFPLFWIWIFYKLIKLNPAAIHSCDLDTVLPCYIYAYIFRKKIVFDMFDRYAMLNIPKKFSILYNIVNSLEETLSHKVNVLITVGEKLANTLKKRPKNCVIITNCSDDSLLSAPNLNKKNKNKINLIYTGPILKNHRLEEIANIVKDFEDIRFVIAGRSIHKDVFENLIKCSNIEYKGVLLPNEAISLTASSDIMIALYDLNEPQNIFAMPNKLFESMMCGIPIITNVAKELIEETNCGIVVKYENMDQIKSAIMELKNNYDLRKRLGDNGRKAFLQKYNWKNMELKLYDIYDKLLDNNFN